MPPTKKDLQSFHRVKMSQRKASSVRVSKQKSISLFSNQYMRPSQGYARPNNYMVKENRHMLNCQFKIAARLNENV